MDFKTYQNSLSQLSARFNLMVFLVFGLLVANILLSAFIWKIWGHQKVEYMPFSGSPSYIKSDTAVDSHYLRMMSENFIYARLNITPESVAAAHQRLLGFVDSASYASMLKTLKEEQGAIIQQKISSVFDMGAISVDTKDLSADIRGVLRRYVALRALKPQRLTYHLRFNYKQGRLSILSFTYTTEKS